VAGNNAVVTEQQQVNAPSPLMTPPISIERTAGAAAIVAQAILLASAEGVEISDVVWDIGDDLTHEHAHRLDLLAADKSVRLYFTEPELTTSGHTMRSKRVTERLQRAIAQLMLRTPAPTYTLL